MAEGVHLMLYKNPGQTGCMCMALMGCSVSGAQDACVYVCDLGNYKDIHTYINHSVGPFLYSIWQIILLLGFSLGCHLAEGKHPGAVPSAQDHTKP